MALWVQLVILASPFVAGSTLWGEFLVCPTLSHCGSGPTVWDTAPRFWCGVRLSERRESLSSVQGQSPGMGSGAPRSQLFVKIAARVPVPYGLSDTVSDILMVSLTSISLYTCLTSRLDLSL